MFNEAKYWEVNREERFYCFLLAHAILSSENFRKRIIDNIKAFNGLNPNNVEVYIEAAALRDYWNNLGDPKEYDSTTAQNRMKVLNEILTIYEIEDCLANPALNFFWTSANRKKLWNPGRWEITTEEKKSIKEEKLKKLYNIKWAFNAKPDILLVSGNAVVMIEAKVESGVGDNEDSGYEQLGIQSKYIARIMQELIPAFANKNFQHIYLTQKLDVDEEKLKTNNFTSVFWQDLVGLLSTDSVDTFTLNCLKRFI